MPAGIMVQNTSQGAETTTIYLKTTSCSVLLLFALGYKNLNYFPVILNKALNLFI